MKSKKESVYFFKPLLGLLLLFALVSFQPYSPVSFPADTQTEWVGEELAPKKTIKAGFYFFPSDAIPQKTCYTTVDFHVMLKSQDQVFQLKLNLQNFQFTNFKKTLHKHLFKAALEIYTEAPIFSDPV